MLLPFLPYSVSRVLSSKCVTLTFVSAVGSLSMPAPPSSLLRGLCDYVGPT